MKILEDSSEKLIIKSSGYGFWVQQIKSVIIILLSFYLSYALYHQALIGKWYYWILILLMAPYGIIKSLRFPKVTLTVDKVNQQVIYSSISLFKIKTSTYQLSEVVTTENRNIRSFSGSPFMIKYTYPALILRNGESLQLDIPKTQGSRRVPLETNKINEEDRASMSRLIQYLTTTNQKTKIKDGSLEHISLP